MAVDIVVPIFNAKTDVLNLLASLHAHAPAYAQIYLVDDASTDPEIAPLLTSFSARAQIKTTVLSNAVNLGFIGSVNRALSVVKNDVLLLNSDTIVTDGWLDAMRQLADREPTVASITPWSNNAEICSFPNFCQNNPAPSGLKQLATAVKALAAETIELPTGMGFCMWMSQKALRAVGDFDQALFGRGYGEENDWCLRARAHGFKNLFCARAFVAHVGGQSFAQTGERPGGENLRRLNARYPYFDAEVAHFIQRDPLRSLRAQLSSMLGETQT
jgi:GT2 family glycosyltransferase